VFATSKSTNNINILITNIVTLDVWRTILTGTDIAKLVEKCWVPKKSFYNLKKLIEIWENYNDNTTDTSLSEKYLIKIKNIKIKFDNDNNLRLCIFFVDRDEQTEAVIVDVPVVEQTNVDKLLMRMNRSEKNINKTNSKLPKEIEFLKNQLNSEKLNLTKLIEDKTTTLNSTICENNKIKFKSIKNVIKQTKTDLGKLIKLNSLNISKNDTNLKKSIEEVNSNSDANSKTIEELRISIEEVNSNTDTNSETIEELQNSTKITVQNITIENREPGNDSAFPKCYLNNNDGIKMVHLSGTVLANDQNIKIPAGCWPTHEIRFVGSQKNNTITKIIIGGSGAITFHPALNNPIDLNGISFIKY